MDEMNAVRLTVILSVRVHWRYILYVILIVFPLYRHIIIRPNTIPVGRSTSGNSNINGKC